LQHQYRLKQNYEVKVIKHIPIAAGLGGSSTDGAAVIKCICKHQKININRLNLKNIALDLSSDMPFFIKNFNTAIISNYGEKVVKYTKSLPKFKVILTNVAFNTKNVYSQ
jgi:4-diphosphocytidyl-2-C-methyl-D-erythritol kinase